MELVYSGKLHGFMRMYWAKKILEVGRRRSIFAVFSIVKGKGAGARYNDPSLSHNVHQWSTSPKDALDVALFLK